MDSCIALIPEGILVFFQVLYYIIKSIILWIIPTSSKSLEDEIVLITGGGRGIGRSLAIEFAKQGCKKIVLWGRTAESLLSVSNEVTPYGANCVLYICDVSKQEEVYEQAKKVKKEVGDVTILVNNAGIVLGNATLLESNDGDVMKTIKTNVFGYIWTTKAFLTAMMDGNHGHIVTISSLLAIQSIPGAGVYSASKSANVGFAESLIQEIHDKNRHGVHSTVVLPYLVQTGMFKGIQTRFLWLFPTMTPEYVAQQIVRAVRKNQRFLMLPRIMYLSSFLKRVLPPGAWKEIMKMTGSIEAMQTFVGHDEKKIN